MDGLQQDVKIAGKTKMNKTISEKIAEELCSVQPMPNDCIKNLHDAGKSKNELIKEGYKPVSGLGLMWVKDE